MLENKFLFSNNIYPSLSHSIKTIKLLEKSLNLSLIKANDLIKNNDEETLIEQFGVSDIGFGRLTK